jgi:hypothetical protein
MRCYLAIPFYVAALAVLADGASFAQEYFPYGPDGDLARRRVNRGEFDPKSFEDVRLILRVGNEESLAERLPILLDVAILGQSAREVLPEPALSQLINHPYHTVEILAASGDAALTPIHYVVQWRKDAAPESPPLRPKLAPLRAFEFWTIQVPVSYLWLGGDRVLLSAPGMVRFQARYYGVKYDKHGKLVPDHDVFVESNVVTARVPVAQGADAEALEAVENLPRPQILSTPQELRRGGREMEALERLANAHPNTAYATYANYAIANSLIWNGWGQLQSPESRSLQRGIELVKAALRDPRFVLVEEARELLWQAEVHQSKVSPVAFGHVREFPTIERRPLPYGDN